ncbi:MAG: AmmeMemoRadiSam system radical SAM enzyme [Chitinispirillaceae bacterium]|nr:AmmeMemoRadiSam system radical SAM enzyme [Chitinispirillaceae bacterium]
MKQAAYYQRLNNRRVQCDLCPHHCRIRPGRRGICLTRENIDGSLVSSNFCRPLSLAVDPIEKKPLYHFFPGSSIFSTGPNGCTFKCSFCQNCEISQELLTAREVTPRWLADKVASSGAIGIAYTYSEPIIWFETIMEVGARVRDMGLKNVMVTNGFIEPAPLADLLTLVDAMNIDIKSMNPAFYRRICKGSLEPVLAACEMVKRAGCHLEITHLLIPGENDDPAETESLASFIASHLGKDTPLHLSRYFPRYRMNHASTPEPLLVRAHEIALQHLDFVYLGNMAAAGKENTWCPGCGTLLISRQGYRTLVTDSLVAPGAPQGKPTCGECGREIAMVCCLK